MVKSFLIYLIISIAFIGEALAYKLVIVQTVSRSKQTFITRIGKDKTIFNGKKSTFTANNISLIATAVSVSRDFVQWEIDNKQTSLPFKKGDIITMYEAKEYLWTLNPEKSRKRLIKTEIFHPSQSIEINFNLSRGISESTSEAVTSSTQRGGFQFGAAFGQEINERYSMAFGLRYSKDVVSLETTSFTNQRFIGIIEGRYHFSKMEDFNNAAIYLGLGVGFGQSRTELESAVNFGTSIILPLTKIGLKVPVGKSMAIGFESGFESVRLDEEDVSGETQSTNLIHAKVGLNLFKEFN